MNDIPARLRASPRIGDSRLPDEAADEIERLTEESTALRLDAERYRWLRDNNFDREGVMQVHTWRHTWEPHSKTGEPTEWVQRIRGGALDAAIDAAMKEKP